MRYFLSSQVKPLQYQASGNLISKHDFLHLRRNLDFYVLILVREGSLYLSLNGVNYQVNKNQYVLLAAKEEHFGYHTSSGRLSYLWVHFTFSEPVIVYEKSSFFNEKMEYILGDVEQNYYILPEYGQISLTQRAPLLFHQLLDLSRQEILYSKQMMDYSLSLFVMELTQEFLDLNYSIKKDISPSIARVMEWIKGNYYKDITVKEIADEFGYNHDYLSGLFKKSTGLTLVQYINTTRISMAKSLISNYEVSVKEAAYTCGYADEKYFMKVFKKVEGMTPSQYKQAFHKKRIN